MAASVAEALAEVDAMIAANASCDEVLAGLDRCLALPGGAEAQAGIAHRRVTVLAMAGRPADEVEQALDEFLRVEPALWRRCAATLAACAEYASIAAHRLDSTIATLTAAAPSDPVSANVLQSALAVRARLRSGTSP